MKNISVTIVLSSMFLFSCGGSGGGGATETPKKGVVASLSNTSWEKECSSYNKLSTDDSVTLWNTKTSLSIDASLKSTYRTAFFHPTDTACNSVMFDTIDIAQFEVIGKVISEESIEAYGLNETFTYNSGENALKPNYTLLYIDSEKLYFGQKSGSNLGDTSETRHSSISLDDYFSQVIN